jgi:hypothetical protein
MASDSQMVASPSTRTGTLPVGENTLNAGLPAPMSNGTSFSWKAMPAVRIPIQGRKDQDE